MIYYTGIGSRSAPEWALELAKHIGYKMASKGYILRSGAANGMDEAFEKGAALYERECDKCTREIWVPWKTFRINEHFDSKHRKVLSDEQAIMGGDYLVSSGVMTYYHRLKHSAKLLHARNVYQVIGDGYKQHKTEPSKLVIYWAPEDDKRVIKGGTRTAVMIARRYEIPTYNLDIEEEKNKVLEFIGDRLPYGLKKL